MKKNILLLLILFLTFSCKKEKASSQGASSLQRTEEKIPYAEYLKEIDTYNQAQKQENLFRYINYEVPYYWQGTPWSFTGSTSEPRKGSIACGYFVTNTLKIYGFDIKASYLAQQPSSVMIKQLCTDVKHFTSVKDLKDWVISKPQKQVYMVGLDFHTGYITREINDVYFIHSNYIQNKGVSKELLEKSRALNSSKTFMIGNLKYN